MRKEGGGLVLDGGIKGFERVVEVVRHLLVQWEVFTDGLGRVQQVSVGVLGLKERGGGESVNGRCT